ncbi:cytochrome P450 [Actinocorallia libanotica]|uniref:Cytochrome P450 n=1 Tax=Actinocorallia libanotica TaxID=46162 RepID=A0ABN1QPT7_9ACTN
MSPVSGSALAAPGAERIFHETMLGLRDADPRPGYRRLREKAPVLLTRDGVLVLTRHADCAAALRHRLLGGRGGAPGLGAVALPDDERVLALRTVQDGMISADPSGHARLRRLVSSAFAGRHVEALRRSVAARVDARLRALARTPGADLMAGLALPLPVDVLADLLGVPETDRAELLPLVGEMNAAFRHDGVPADRARAAHAQAVLADRLGVLLAARRARPEDDLLSRLAASRADDALTADEAVGAALLLLGAGAEPTAHLLGNAVHALLAHPGQYALLRREPSLVPGAVEELLRYDAPVQVVARTVLEPFAFLGARLEPGQTVLALLGAADRDPDRYPEPDRLDVTRDPHPASAHLAFAAGRHCCLGAHLARLVLEVLLQRLVDGHPRCALAGPPVRDGGLALRGFARLPVTLAP